MGSEPQGMMIALGPSDVTVYNLLDEMGREKILF